MTQKRELTVPHYTVDRFGPTVHAIEADREIERLRAQVIELRTEIGKRRKPRWAIDQEQR